MGAGPSPEAMRLYKAAQTRGGGSESMRKMTEQERMSERVELRRCAAIVRGYLENGRNIDGMPFTDHTKTPNDLRREIERLRGENDTLRAICRALLPENWKEQLEEERK